MASTVSKTYTESNTAIDTTRSTWTLQVTGQDITVNSSSFTFPVLPEANVKLKYVGSNKGYADAVMDLHMAPGSGSKVTIGRYVRGDITNSDSSKFVATASGTTYNATKKSEGSSRTVQTSDVFNSNNSTSKTVAIKAFFSTVILRTYNSAGPTLAGNVNNFSRSGSYDEIGTAGTITLNAPPTFTAAVSSSGSYYAGVSQYSVSISSLSAKYGGSISQAKLTVGSQTATRSTNGTLTINLSTAGTFTPTIEVTDSRGQKTTKTLPAITVNPYVAEVQSLTVQRIDDNEALADGGENAVITAKFGYTPYSGNYLLEPTIKVDGTTTNNVTWYTAWSSANGFSNAVNWTNYAPSSPITLYGKCTEAFDADTSYVIGVTPKATHLTGTQITKSLPQAFYLFVGRAGGKALGAGMKPNADGEFDIALEPHIYNKESFYHGNADSRYEGSFPLVNTRLGGVCHKDRHGDNIFYSETYVTSAGQVYTSFITRKYNSDKSNETRAGFYQRINEDGTVVLDFSTAAMRAAWRKALQVDTISNVDIQTSTASDIVTANSDNATITSASYRQYGKVAQVLVVWTNKNDISVPAAGNFVDITVATLNSGKRPAIETNALSNGNNGGGAWYYIGTNGVITLGAVEGTGVARTIAAGTTFRCYSTFILP